MMSLRKSLRETSAPRAEPKFHTLLAHFSNSVSWVTTLSRVMASYWVRPGDLRSLLGSPPSRCRTTSVVRFRALTLLTPATYLPSHFTRNLKFLYGSKRSVLTLNCGIISSLRLELSGHLLDLDDHDLRRLQGCETDHDVHDAAVYVVLRRGLLVALDEVRLPWALALESTLAEERLHEGADVQADLCPQGFVVRFEDHPLRPPVKTLFDVERQTADRDVLPFGRELVGAAKSTRAPHYVADHGESAQAVHAQLVELAVLRVIQPYAQLAHTGQRGLCP